MIEKAQGYLMLMASLILFACPAEGSEALKRTALLRARVYVETGDWERATQTLESLKAAYPGDRSVLVDLASLYSQQGRIEEAEVLYRDLIDRFPTVDAYWNDLAYLLSEAGRDADLIAHLSPRADSLVAAASPIATLLADAYYRLDQVDRAEQVYALLLKGQKSDIPTLLLIGEGYLRQNRQERASDYFNQVLALEPENFRALKGQGLSFYSSDPERAREALKLAAEVGRTDVEAPYYLGELLYPQDPTDAEVYYLEALRRLEKVTVPSVYERSIKARMMARTGQFEQARGIYAELIRQNPNNADMRNDFAELLTERKLYTDALVILDPAGSDVKDPATQRAALLRVRIAFERRNWDRAVPPLLALSRYAPDDRAARIDLADGLQRAGDWAAALDTLDSLLVADDCDAVGERAYEMRRELRRDRGSAVGLTLDHTGLSDGGAFPFRAYYRQYVRPGLGITIDGVDGLYKDDANFNQQDFQGWTGEVGAALHLGSRRNRDITLRARRHFFRTNEQFALGAQGRLDLAGRGQLTVQGDRRKLWTGPVDAVLFDGLMDRLGAEAFVSIIDRLTLAAYASVRQFWIFEDEDFGEDRQAGATLGWEFVRRPYGSGKGLRSATASVGYEASSSTQDPQFAPLIDLIDRSRSLTANLYLHFLFSCRSTLDLWGFAARDPERNLKFGKLYGIGGRFHLDVTDRFSIEANGLQVSESALQQQPGVYREVRAAISYHFSPRDRERSAGHRNALLKRGPVDR